MTTTDSFPIAETDNTRAAANLYGIAGAIGQPRGHSKFDYNQNVINHFNAFTEGMEFTQTDQWQEHFSTALRTGHKNELANIAAQAYVRQIVESEDGTTAHQVAEVLSRFADSLSNQGVTATRLGARARVMESLTKEHQNASSGFHDKLDVFSVDVLHEMEANYMARLSTLGKRFAVVGTVVAGMAYAAKKVER